MTSDPSPNFPRTKRNPLLTIAMVLIGLLLLLPGLCTIGVGIFVISADGLRAVSDPGLFSLWVISIAVSALGVLLLVRAIRG